MKEKKSNKANDMTAANEREKQKKSVQQQPGDKVSEQIFSEVANKDTFGPPKMSYITGIGLHGNSRLVPLDTD